MPSSAWNKAPVFGVIGVQKGPRRRGVHNGFHEEHGGLFGDAGSGDDCEDPACVFRSEEADQGDLPGAWAVTEGRTEDASIRGDGVPLRARVDLPGFYGERLAYFAGLSLEGDGAVEAER